MAGGFPGSLAFSVFIGEVTVPLLVILRGPGGWRRSPETHACAGPASGATLCDRPRCRPARTLGVVGERRTLHGSVVYRAVNAKLPFAFDCAELN